MDSSDHRGCTRSLLGAAVSLYLILLPLGHVLVIPVAGAWATATDVLLAGLLVVGGIVALRGGIGLGKRMQALDPFHMAMALFLLFAGWILLGSLWSATPDYALAKGGATAALVLGAVCIRRSGLGLGRALDAWLLGAMLAVGVSLVLVVLGPELAESRLLYRGGGVSGLPIPRLRGPFIHPNMLGGYLVVSGVLLWARWPALRRWMRSEGDAPNWSGGPIMPWVTGILKVRGMAVLLAFLLTFALLLSFSTAWLAAGLAMLLICRKKTWRSLAGRAFGATVLAVTVAGLLFPLRTDLFGIEIVTNGIRPHIWASAAQAYLDSPLVGMGASPVVAHAASPLVPGGAPLGWDAHSLYLSVLTQFGVPGVLLFGAGVVLLVRTLWCAEASRERTALLVAIMAVAMHGVVTASEDFRHLWALLGMVGLAMDTSR